MSKMEFPGMLKKIGSAVRKDEGLAEVVTTFNIVSQIKGDDQTFFQEFEEAFDTNNFHRLFVEPVRWKKLDMEIQEQIDLKFDAIECTATLTNIKVAVKETADEIIYTYTFMFDKKQSKDVDTALASYLGYKEEDENGKSHFVEYDVELTSL